MTSSSTVPGWPESLCLDAWNAQGATLSVHEVAPGIYTTCSTIGDKSTYYWPASGEELGHWRTVPPPAERFCQKAHLGTIYLTGYGNRSVNALFERVKSLRGYLVDIRYHPMSSREEWRQCALQERFKSRYLHIRTLGNKTHGSGEINIADIDTGIWQLDKCLQDEMTPLVLVCACGKSEGCHRLEIARELTKRGYLTAELEWTNAPV